MGMEHGFSSPRTESFPAGLRVLVVDDDPTWLKILEKMLKKCCYEVTTCGLAREALKLLRDRKDGFDIVISDVNMPDMDGFRLLEHVGLEMDLPVIMMSVDGETSRVMKGVQHGACDYLLKPIRMKELKNIWQHVVRKRMHEVSNIECIEDRIGTDHSFDGHYGSEQMFLKKRKDVDKHDEKDSSDTSTAKKARVVWTVELHQKFVKAVNQLGIDSDKIGPKKILDLMNVPWLTRENVASHLQKYRLYLSRIRKEDNLESSYGGGMKIPDQSPKESSGSFNHNSSFGQHNDITSKYKGCKGHQLPVQASDSEPIESSMGSSKLLSLTEKSIPCSTEDTSHHKSRNSQLSLNHTHGSLDIGMQHASFDSSVSGQSLWGQAVSDLQFQKELKPHPELDNCFGQPAVPIMQPHINPVLLEPAPHIKPNLLDPAPRISADLLDTAAPHINTDYVEPSPHISPGPVIAETNSLGLIDIKPLNAEAGAKSANDTEKLSSMESPLGSFPVSNSDAFGFGFDMKDQNFSQGAHSIENETLLQRVYQSLPMQTKSHLADAQGLDPGFDETLEMKKQSSCQGSIAGQSSVTVSEPEPRNQVLWSESVSGIFGEDLIRWQQCVDVTSKDFGLDFIGFSGCNFPDNDYGNPWPFYVPKLDNDYPFDSVEHPLDQRLLFS